MDTAQAKKFWRQALGVVVALLGLFVLESSGLFSRQGSVVGSMIFWSLIVTLIIWTKRRNLQSRQTLIPGWDVPLFCRNCGLTDVPIFHPLEETKGDSFGKKPLIDASIRCRACSEDLKKEAEKELVYFFRDLPNDPRFGRMIWLTLLCLNLCLGLLSLGKALHLYWLRVIGLVVGCIPLLVSFNRKKSIAIRSTCSCGNPAYKFMGRLGPSDCHRCSNCGRLLRLRD